MNLPYAAPRVAPEKFALTLCFCRTTHRPQGLDGWKEPSWRYRSLEGDGELRSLQAKLLRR